MNPIIQSKTRLLVTPTRKNIYEYMSSIRAIIVQHNSQTSHSYGVLVSFPPEGATTLQ
jgi:uncharacterized membrane protein